MSICVTIGGHCACLKIRVKWCEKCQMYICRVMYPSHRHATAEVRRVWYAQDVLLNLLCRRIRELRYFDDPRQ